ncbi:MAG: Hsp70 family protein [Bdellovibrionales bacterium]
MDFGTSNSLVSYVRPGEPARVLTIDNNHSDPHIMRSLMYFPFEDGEPSFGQNAIQNYIKAQGQGRFIRSVKKFLPAKSFKATQIKGQIYSLEEIIGRFLRELKHRADALTGEDVQRVLLGRPARFHIDDERDQLAQDRLKEAAERAGFEVIAFCPEPLAAALDYQQQIQRPKKVLVVDLGGGTSDFTIIRLKPGPQETLETLGLNGVSVAGDKLDGSLMTTFIGPYFGTEVQYKFPMGNNVLTMPPELKSRLASPADITLLLKSDIMSFIRDLKKSILSPADEDRLENLFALVEENLGFALYEEIEKTKQTVCSEQVSRFQFENSGIEISLNLTYDDFIQCNSSHFNQIFGAIDSLMESAQLSPQEIDTVFTTGGTSRVPFIQKKLVEMFGAEKLHHQEAFHSVIERPGRKSQLN